MADFQEFDNEKGNKGKGNNIYWIYILILAAVVFVAWFFNDAGGSAKVEIKPLEFNELCEKKMVDQVIVYQNVNKVEAKLNTDGSNYINALYQEKATKQNPNVKPPKIVAVYALTASNDDMVRFLREKNISYEARKEIEYGSILNLLFPIIIFVVLWIVFMRRIGGGGGQIFNIGKSRASLYDKENKVSVTFEDVAGIDEGKEEVQEVVEFLKNPSKFTKLGGHIPKGVLLVGPPGTGKTLLAKAVAGEAKVPFFSLSGSDFVEMFVGVGAARVRDLFKQAKEKAPCIIFIDEIDAVGRSRGKGNFTGGNDERENTLNQLLVEMDGFNSDVGVILMAATNRPDVLDSALLRPGRFDRQIYVDRPDVKGRAMIFKVHLKKLKTAEDVNPDNLAGQTPGSVGADIMNICNEAALIAARKGKELIDKYDFQDAIDRVMLGMEKKSKILTPKEKEVVAYHEAGHAVVSWFLEHTPPINKVTIIPRGRTGGHAQYLDTDRSYDSQAYLEDMICMALGGRVAEDIIYQQRSMGAQGDLQQITRIAYAMVTMFGMNDKVGHISFKQDDEFAFSKPYSDETARIIDQEVKHIIDQAYARTHNLLTEKRAQLEAVAKELMDKEVIFREDMERILGARPYEEESPVNHVQLQDFDAPLQD